MKNILTITALAAFVFCVQAQVIITEGEPSNPGFNTTNVLLGFGDFDERGIILPQTSANITQNGSFSFNNSSGINAVVVYENGVEKPLSFTTGGGTAHNFSLSGNNVGEGAVIGDYNKAKSEGKEGVLILESSNKALVLPRVPSPHLNIKSPIAGTICYDTNLNMMAVYDGDNWYYWE